MHSHHHPPVVIPIPDKDKDFFYIICGHKQPDADSICSAIGLAELKYALHPEIPRGTTTCLGRRAKWTAVRCGESNPKIDVILKRFNVPLPPLYTSITPRVRHIMASQKSIVFAYKGTTCTEVLQIMQASKHSVLPVIDPEKVTDPYTGLCGLVTFVSLGQFFIPVNNRTLRVMSTTLMNVVKSIKGENATPRPTLIDPTRKEELTTLCVSWSVEEAEALAAEERVDYAKCIIVTTPQCVEVQHWALDKGVRLLVINGHGMAPFRVDHEIVVKAQAKGLNLVTTTMDSYSLCWAIRGSALIDSLVDSHAMLPCHAEDRLAEMRKRLAHSDAIMCAVQDEKARLVGLLTRKDFQRPLYMRLILVDHNELGQAIPGADECEITEIVDHHRLGNAPTNQPIIFYNHPVGSTSTIVADMFRQSDLTPSVPIAGVLMGGIISDTLNLRGPTTTPVDVNILAWLAEITQEDPNALATAIFSAGSIFEIRTPDQIVVSDYKEFHEGDLRYSVTQVEEVGFANFWANRDPVCAALSALRAREKFHFSALLVTDINTQRSLFVYEGSADVSSRIKYPAVDSSGTIFEMPFVSRKMQVIPYLIRLLKEDQ